jgi:hypothetical protein
MYVYTMKDILDDLDVLCKKCKVPMDRGTTTKDGFQLRIFQCPKCKTAYYHPTDLEKYEQYKLLKERHFNMKLRQIGNSFCISIPSEIIKFSHIQENSFVSISMEDPENVRLIFHKSTTVRGISNENNKER